MDAQKPFRLILASGSPARKELLTRAGYSFTVLPSNIDEPTNAGFTDPRTLVAHIAWLKAAAVAPQVDQGIVLAADTVGWHEGQPIGKPADESDARRILRTISGTEHELWTGVCLWRRPDGLQLAWQEVSIVRVPQMDERDLDGYIKTRKWEGCSGAYAIEEGEDPYVRVVQGSFSNVVGLPMETLASALSSLTDG
jgi:septum formation protein